MELAVFLMFVFSGEMACTSVAEGEEKLVSTRETIYIGYLSLSSMPSHFNLFHMTPTAHMPLPLLHSISK